jgi:hypothetical protein
MDKGYIRNRRTAQKHSYVTSAVLFAAQSYIRTEEEGDRREKVRTGSNVDASGSFKCRKVYLM